MTGTTEFPWGHDAWSAAAGHAAGCQTFSPDVEEEWVADDVVSCYNCRFRRWTAASFTCMASDM